MLYISPLRALAVDVEKNLRAPLAGIELAAERLGEHVHKPRVAMRTGDTSAAERRRIIAKPPDVLITTPESLYLMLTSQAREVLRGVRWIIVDEIHAMAGSKRGAHLALSLERLEELADEPPQRIGLSATQRPLDEIARFLGGQTEDGPRPVTIVDAGHRKPMEVEVVVPIEDMSELGTVQEATAPGVAPERMSIWPAIHPRLLELIRAHRSTIVFVNARRMAERLAARLNELAGEDLVRAHHGSIAREQRLQIEDELKRGTLRCIVATSSLELGIDMGAVDLVIQVESPGSVSRGLQRIGRAGHRVGEPSRGKVFPKYRGDLLEATVVVRRMLDGLIEETRYPRNPLDVLAQQIVAMCAVDEWTVADLARVVRRAANFAELSDDVLRAVLDLLSGATPATTSPTCGPGSSGTGGATRCGPARARGGWRSRTPARSRTAACSACSRRTGAAWASSTKRWCTRAGAARCSSSAPRRGGSRTSRSTGWWSRPRRASRARCRSGTATSRGVRWSSAGRSASSRASSRRSRTRTPSAACARSSASMRSPPRTSFRTSMTSARRPVCSPTTARS